jgi:RNA polymerase sigma factor (sigma-70 family)
VRLARACDAGAPGAWERLQKQYRKRLLGFLRRRGARRGEADQVLEEAWGALAAPPPRGGARTAIGTYDGRGSLHAWMATILWRRLTDRWRARSAAARLPAPATQPGLHARDPADRVADTETARLLGAALEEAWPRLTPRELQAVVLKYRHQLPQTEIATTLGVGTPRVTRLLESATTRLRASIEARLGPRLGWDADGAGSSGLFEAVERVLARGSVEVARPPDRRAGHG